jgi:hypothetical protein
LNSVDIAKNGYRFCALDSAVTHRFLGFVNEVIDFRLSSRTLRVLVLRPVHPKPRANDEWAAVFFAPGVAGVAIALWAMDIPRGAPMPKALLRALNICSNKFLEVTAPEEIHSALTGLSGALEAELSGTPKIALMLTPAFAGAAFNLAVAAAANEGMPLSGNSSLANYLSTFHVGCKAPVKAAPAAAQDREAYPTPMPRQLL